MVNVGLWVRVQAKPGRERDLAEFLTGARAVVEDEPETVAWLAVATGRVHLRHLRRVPRRRRPPGPPGRRRGQGISEKGPELLREPPSIEYVGVLASKLPGRA